MVRWGGMAYRWLGWGSFDHGSNLEGCHDSYPLGWPMTSWIFSVAHSVILNLLFSIELNVEYTNSMQPMRLSFHGGRYELLIFQTSNKEQQLAFYLLQICFCLSLKELGCRARVIALRKSTKLQHFEINCTTLKAEIASSPQLSPTQVMLSTKIQHGNHFRHHKCLSIFVGVTCPSQLIYNSKSKKHGV